MEQVHRPFGSAMEDCGDRCWPRGLLDQTRRRGKDRYGVYAIAPGGAAPVKTNALCIVISVKRRFGSNVHGTSKVDEWQAPVLLVSITRRFQTNNGILASTDHGDNVFLSQ